MFGVRFRFGLLLKLRGKLCVNERHFNYNFWVEMGFRVNYLTVYHFVFWFCFVSCESIWLFLEILFTNIPHFA